MPDLPRGPHFDADPDDISLPWTIAVALCLLVGGGLAVWGLYAWLAGMLGM